MCWILGHDWFQYKGGYYCNRCGNYHDCGRKKIYRNYKVFQEDFNAWDENFRSGKRWQSALQLANLAEDPLCEIDEYGRGCKPDKPCDACKMRKLAKIVKEWPNIPIEELRD